MTHLFYFCVVFVRNILFTHLLTSMDIVGQERNEEKRKDGKLKNLPLTLVIIWKGHTELPESLLGCVHLSIIH